MAATSPATYSTVASTIQTIEGWFAGSVSQRNNNPGNLKYAGQPGAIGADASGFAIFTSVDAGQQALQNQIALDASRGLTIGQFASKYAPAQDGNDPASYAAQLAAATGLSVTDPLSAAAEAGAGSNSAGSSSGGGQDLYTAVSALPSSDDTAGDYMVDLSGIGLGEYAVSQGMLLGIGAGLVGLLWLMNRSR